MGFSIEINLVQYLWNKKDAKWASSDHRLSKFDRSVVVNLKSISYFLGCLYRLVFDLETIGVSEIIMWWLIFEKKSFQFWREIWIQVLVMLLQRTLIQELPTKMPLFDCHYEKTSVQGPKLLQDWSHQYWYSLLLGLDTKVTEICACHSV